jgi:hypothetical protein
MDKARFDEGAAMAHAHKRPYELKLHIKSALTNGVTKDDSAVQGRQSCFSSSRALRTPGRWSVRSLNAV